MSRELEDLLRAARETLPEPDEEVGRRARERVLATVMQRRSRGWTLLAFAVAIALASAAGFGFGHRFGPEQVHAARPGGVSGAGFFPAAGWNTFQRGGRSLAANVPIHPNDLARDSALPIATLRALPRDGTVIVAELVPARLVAAVGQSLPFRLADAEPRLQQVGGRRLLVQRLRARVEAYVVDVSVFFGTRKPSAAVREQAQLQLDRLVVAAPQVTIRAELHVNPDVPFSRWVEVSGTIASSSAGEVVEVLARDCGPRAPRFYRLVGSARSVAGGSWSLQTLRDGAPIPGIPSNAFFRARWNGAQSEPVLVRVPIFVNAFWWNRRHTVIGALVVPRDTGQNVRRKYVELQRRVPGTDEWARVRRARLGRPPKIFDNPDTYWATFAIRMRGQTWRVLVPEATAAPCYRPTVSPLVKP